MDDGLSWPRFSFGCWFNFIIQLSNERCIIFFKQFSTQDCRNDVEISIKWCHNRYISNIVRISTKNVRKNCRSVASSVSTFYFNYLRIYSELNNFCSSERQLLYLKIKKDLNCTLYLRSNRNRPRHIYLCTLGSSENE